MVRGHTFFKILTEHGPTCWLFFLIITYSILFLMRAVVAAFLPCGGPFSTGFVLTPNWLSDHKEENLVFSSGE